jgi:hypothetical protein
VVWITHPVLALAAPGNSATPRATAMAKRRLTSIGPSPSKCCAGQEGPRHAPCPGHTCLRNWRSRHGRARKPCHGCCCGGRALRTYRKRCFSCCQSASQTGIHFPIQVPLRTRFRSRYTFRARGVSNNRHPPGSERTQDEEDPHTGRAGSGGSGWLHFRGGWNPGGSNVFCDTALLAFGSGARRGALAVGVAVVVAAGRHRSARGRLRRPHRGKG